MKLSILIPVYNEVATFQMLLNAVKAVPLDMEKEIIIVDDASTDGTKDLLAKLDDPQIRVFFHEKNGGKGKALQTAIEKITGDLVIIQDADLEYYPDEYSFLLKPILERKADVVFGSRFIGVHRCFLFSHYMGNKVVNLIANILYDTTLSDFMTCYKAFRAQDLKKIRLQASRFGIEAEITGEVFRRGLRVYEVPISYSGRNHDEGKKIKWWDIFPVLYWLVRTKCKKL